MSFPSVEAEKSFQDAFKTNYFHLSKMNKQKYFNYYDAELNAVVSVFEGYPSHEQFKRIISEAIDVIRETGCKKLMAQTQNLRMISSENQEWVETNGFPSAVAMGLKQMAFIVPTNAFGRISLKNSNRTAIERELPIQIRYFEDENSAREWIKGKN